MEFIQNSLAFVDGTVTNREEVLSDLAENTLPPSQYPEEKSRLASTECS